jgi:hypothetical protein
MYAVSAANPTLPLFIFRHRHSLFSLPRRHQAQLTVVDVRGFFNKFRQGSSEAFGFRMIGESFGPKPPTLQIDE